jgi:Pol polyprotein, beta-barrel domain
MRMQEQLAGMNTSLTNNDLVTVILSSLPKSYHLLINAKTMSAAHVKAKLEPDQVVSMLINKFKRLTIEECQLKASENALAAVKGRGKAQGRNNASSTTKSDLECWNCGKKGQMKADCRSKAKKKDNKKGGGSANTVTEGGDFAFTMMFAGTALTLGTSQLTGQEINVYDLGVSGHMSPNRHRFVTFKEITPHAINTADKTIFKATGIGNMRIAIPNGKTTTHITLKDVLYFLDLAFTLVSLTHCDAAGYSVLLKDRKCLIRDTKGTLLGQVPLSNGLYKVDHRDTAVAANTA